MPPYPKISPITTASMKLLGTHFRSRRECYQPIGPAQTRNSTGALTASAVRLDVSVTSSAQNNAVELRSRIQAHCVFNLETRTSFLYHNPRKAE